MVNLTESAAELSPISIASCKLFKEGRLRVGRAVVIATNGENRQKREEKIFCVRARGEDAPVCWTRVEARAEAVGSGFRAFVFA
ncbi:hypothetical protein TSUD_96580 [Trifolium subterraneum]|nr:hypothetical protein TSUD_96580 [Trifolium subterraneum]